MPLIPLLGGALAGWFIRTWNVALAVTAVLFAVAVGLLGFPLAWLMHKLRTRRSA